MRYYLCLLLFFAAFLPAESQSIIAGTEAAGKFENIPESELASAISARIMFRHASVGTTINDGLNCLQGTRTNPAECRNYPEYKFDRRAWVFQSRGNNGWKGKIDDFAAEVNSQNNDFDFFSFKYCYIDGIDGLLDPCGSPYSDSKMYSAWEYLKQKMESLETQFPEKKFLWWTIPLTQTGQKCTDTLNSLIRNYCRESGKYLFDIADIQCHDSLGNKVLSSSGYEVAFPAYCGEQQPGAQACHPNWTGKLILAKAYWWFITQITNSHTNVESDNLEAGFKIAPNPVYENCEIVFNKLTSGNVTFRIYDCIGVLKGEITDNSSDNYSKISFDTKKFGLGSGIYIIAASHEGQIFTEKISVIK